MTDLENQFLKQLTSAAWPLLWQIVFGTGFVIGYYVWSVFYYRVIDAALRSFFGSVVGASLIWVLRHSSSYQTAFEFSFVPIRYYRWSWGIAAEAKRTFLRDGAVFLLSLIMVNVLSGIWPAAIFLYVFIELKALSYVVFLPVCLAVIVIYAAFWSGRYEIKGMQKAALT